MDKLKNIKQIGYVAIDLTSPVRLYRETIAFGPNDRQVQLPAKAEVTVLEHNGILTRIRYKRTEYNVGFLELVEWENKQ